MTIVRIMNGKIYQKRFVPIRPNYVNLKSVDLLPDLGPRCWIIKGPVAQGVDHLPSKCKSLSSKPQFYPRKKVPEFFKFTFIVLNIYKLMFSLNSPPPLFNSR
jgi:hypothetical protein